MRHDQTAPSGSPREAEPLQRLLRHIEITQDHEIDCSVCLEQVPIYVDRELGGVDVAREMADLHLHLALCGDCFEEYEALRDLARLELAGDLPDRATLLRQLNRE